MINNKNKKILKKEKEKIKNNYSVTIINFPVLGSL